MKPITTTNTTRKHLTKEEKTIKGGIEDSIKGLNLPSTPPRSLTKEQKKIYKWLYDNLAPSDVLSILDLQTITQACRVIERLNVIDAKIDAKLKTGESDRGLEIYRKDYFAQYLKICAELCLSPAARAKIGTMALNAHKAKKDALMDALNVGDDADD